MAAYCDNFAYSGGMNSPNPLGRGSEPDDLRARANAPGLSLRAYVDREAAALATAGGPTMADILDELDRYRRPDGPSTRDIVNAIHEGRRER